jgi:protein-S-isoprenylcysteine O-methyltransferase Ste14
MKPAALVATVILSVVSVAHLLRLVLRVPVTVGDAVVPSWVSLAGFLVAGGVAFALWRENRAPPP